MKWKQTTLIFCYAFFLNLTISFSQNLNLSVSFSLKLNIDSLKKTLDIQKEDTNNVNTLNQLAHVYWLKYVPDTAKIYANKALQIAEQLKYKKGEALAYFLIGGSDQNINNYPEAFTNLRSALKIATDINYQWVEAMASSKISTIYSLVGDMSEAIKYRYMSIKYFEVMNWKYGVADMLQSLAFMETADSSDEVKIKRFTKVLNLRKENGDSAGYAQTLLTIGGLQKDYRIATAMANEGLAIYQILDKRAEAWGIPFAYSTLAGIFEKRGDSAKQSGNDAAAATLYKYALTDYLISLKGWEEISKNKKATEGQNGFIQMMGIVGNIYIKLKNNLKASEFINKAFKLSWELKNKKLIYGAYKALAELDSAQGDFKRSLEEYKLFILYRDSIYNGESKSKAEGYKLRYEFDKKEDSLKQRQILTETKLRAQKKQKYFYWGGIIMLSALLFFVFLNFRNQKKINGLAAEAHARQKAELELQIQRNVLNERLRISTELHDEVGATLSGIAMYSHLTKEQMRSGQTTEIERSLNIMQQSSAQMVDKLSDIVWLINPEQDSLQKLVTRLEEYARDMAAIKNMQVKISVPEKIANIDLPVESRRNIYLFCKEAINNAVKYSNASLLELTIRETEGKLEFSVRDNGKGFDAVMVRRGNGLENMQKRADEIGAKLVLQSKENEGASVSLQCKIT